jgi:tetraacyldisaccharide 4'-kinase
VKLLDAIWYGRSPLAYLLLPLSGIFLLLSMLRRIAFRTGLKKIQHPGVPVIVVGNLTVGGTGKTPLVVWMADYLKAKGYHPGIISRGYGGKAKYWPQQVRPDSDPVSVGDEAILLSRRTGCPMAVGPDRYEAAKSLVDNSDCDILISDDGLQHYGLGRDIEIVVIDGKRRFGNRLLLPAGPMREGLWRLEHVDIVLVNGDRRETEDEMLMRIKRGELVSLGKEKITLLSDLAGSEVHAVAGIGNPERFFMLLRNSGLKVIEHRFKDHHDFRAEDLDFGDDRPVIMTEKDAVKCQRYVGDGYWFLQVSAQPDADFVQKFYELIGELEDGQETA